MRKPFVVSVSTVVHAEDAVEAKRFVSKQLDDVFGLTNIVVHDVWEDDQYSAEEDDE